VSVHGGDVLYTAPRSAAGRRAVERTFGAARLVLANSAWTEARTRALGATATRVVHLGTDLPAEPGPPPPDDRPVLASVGHLVPRKRHADVIRAVAILRDRLPGLRYAIVGDGPERGALGRLAAELGVADRVELRGQLPPEEAVAVARRASLFVLPSVDEAFGVAYVEAMAGGVPAIGCRGEGGPEEIAALGEGMRLVAPGDVDGLAAEIAELLEAPERRRELGERARALVAEHFTWVRSGRETVAAYEQAVAADKQALGR
jgi:glycosyltransferase involved in cell wall biosynthesis